jgi:hypothetical protein
MLSVVCFEVRSEREKERDGRRKRKAQDIFFDLKLAFDFSP